MQEVVAVTDGERAFRDAPLVRVEIPPLVAIVGVRKASSHRTRLSVVESDTVSSSNRVIVRVSYFTVGAVKVGLLTSLSFAFRSVQPVMAWAAWWVARIAC
jgi:hypothetical protein